MESGMMNLLISLVSGAVGGNLAGAVLKNKTLGTLWNSVVGILGGGIGGSLLGILELGDTAGIVGTIASSTVGGAVLLFIVSLFKK
jgi:uncharacterized membrane protein YeaQ/YmgE (transglycosylase-associated protein family)